MQILRTDWQGRGKWRKVAQHFNEIGRLINDIIGVNGIDVSYQGGRLVVSADIPTGGAGAAFPWSKLSFGYRLITDTEADPPERKVRIYPGAIRMHGVAVYHLAPNLGLDGAGDEIALSGADVWVFAQVTRGASPGAGVGIGMSSNEPLTTTTTLRIPLYRFTLEGDRYVLAQICNMGDINLDTPLL